MFTDIMQNISIIIIFDRETRLLMSVMDQSLNSKRLKASKYLKFKWWWFMF